MLLRDLATTSLFLSVSCLSSCLAQDVMSQFLPALQLANAQSSQA